MMKASDKVISKQLLCNSGMYHPNSGSCRDSRQIISQNSMNLDKSVSCVVSPRLSSSFHHAITEERIPPTITNQLKQRQSFIFLLFSATITMQQFQIFFSFTKFLGKKLFDFWKCLFYFRENIFYNFRYSKTKKWSKMEIKDFRVSNRKRIRNLVN